MADTLGLMQPPLMQLPLALYATMSSEPIWHLGTHQSCSASLRWSHKSHRPTLLATAPCIPLPPRHISGPRTIGNPPISQCNGSALPSPHCGPDPDCDPRSDPELWYGGHDDHGPGIWS